MNEKNTFGLSCERMAQLDENYRKVTEKIAAAEQRSNNGGVHLVAATKYALAEEINYMVTNLGLKSIGENRVQALTEKYDSLVKDVDIQLIGSLQTNKVKYIASKVSLIQSLDSLRLAKEIDTQAKKLGIVIDTLLEINIGGEENKGGVAPEDVSGMLDELKAFDSIRVKGLMTMAPVCESDDEYKVYFSKTRDIFDGIALNKLTGIDSPILSMGMSNSYEAAIECGATMVRVGSALFR